MSLIAWFPLNKNALIDKCGHPITTTISLPSYSTAGILGGSYSFSAHNIKMTNMHASAEMSFALWLCFTTTASCHIIDFRHSSGEVGYQPIYYNTSSGVQIYSSASPHGGYIVTGTLAINTWYHMVVTISNGYGKLYLNGEYKGQVAVGNPNCNTELFIGSRCSGANRFPGYLSDVRIYDHALSLKEIKDLSKAMVLHYDFEEQSPTLITDNTGNDNNGTINGVVISEDAAHGLQSTYYQNGQQWIETSNLPVINNAISVSMWFKSSSTSPRSGYHILFAIDGGRVEISIPSNGQLRWGGYTSTNGRVCNNITVKNASGTTFSLLNGQWHLINIIYDGTGWLSYVDGIYQAKHAATGTISYSGKLLRIGKYTAGATSNYGATDAYIDDVRIYNTVLTAEDIEELYKTKKQLDRNGSAFIAKVNDESQTKVSVSKNSVQYSSQVCEVIVLDDGSHWLQVSHHDNKGGTNLFNSSDAFATSFVYHNEDCWAAFPLIKEYGNYGGKYEFLAIEQLTTTSDIILRRWSQTVDPFTATYDTAKRSSGNFTAISNIPTINGGMYKLGTTNTFFCICNATKGNWYGAFGASNKYGNGIPSFDNKSTAGVLDLFVRVSSYDANIYREFKNGVIMLNTVNEI